MRTTILLLSLVAIFAKLYGPDLVQKAAVYLGQEELSDAESYDPIRDNLDTLKALVYRLAGKK